MEQQTKMSGEEHKSEAREETTAATAATMDVGESTQLVDSSLDPSLSSDVIPEDARSYVSEHKSAEMEGEEESGAHKGAALPLPLGSPTAAAVDLGLSLSTAEDLSPMPTATAAAATTAVNLSPFTSLKSLKTEEEKSGEQEEGNMQQSTPEPQSSDNSIRRASVSDTSQEPSSSSNVSIPQLAGTMKSSLTPEQMRQFMHTYTRVYVQLLSNKKERQDLTPFEEMYLNATMQSLLVQCSATENSYQELINLMTRVPCMQQYVQLSLRDPRLLQQQQQMRQQLLQLQQWQKASAPLSIISKCSACSMYLAFPVTAAEVRCPNCQTHSVNRRDRSHCPKCAQQLSYVSNKLPSKAESQDMQAMVVKCTSCQTQLSIDDKKVPEWSQQFASTAAVPAMAAAAAASSSSSSPSTHSLVKLEKPSKNVTARVQYQRTHRREFEARFPSYTSGEITSKLGEAYKQLGEDQKQIYFQAAEVDKQRYESEMAKWEERERDRETQSAAAASSMYSSSIPTMQMHQSSQHQQPATAPIMAMYSLHQQPIAQRQLMTHLQPMQSFMYQQHQQHSQQQTQQAAAAGWMHNYPITMHTSTAGAAGDAKHQSQ